MPAGLCNSSWNWPPQYPPSRAAEITGCRAEDIVGLARSIARAKDRHLRHPYGFDPDLSRGQCLRPGNGGRRDRQRLRDLPGRASARPSSTGNPFCSTDPQAGRVFPRGDLALYDAVIAGKPFPVKALWLSFINFLNQCVDSGKIIREYSHGLISSPPPNSS